MCAIPVRPVHDHFGSDGQLGFVRSPAGAFTSFQVPGGFADPRAISPSGIICGYYTLVGDRTFVAHGFVRAADGTITTFDAPGAGTGAGFGFPLQQGTFPNAINQAGTISGYFSNQPLTGYPPVAHGFIRAADGTFTVFDFPGAGAGSTTITSISPSGEIAGSAADANNFEISVGFVRSPQGTMTLFAYPAAHQTEPLAINAKGEIVGIYNLSSSFLLIP